MPAGATEAYEALRQRVVRPEGPAQYVEGKGVFIRCGLAQWAHAQAPTITGLQSADAPPPSVRSQHAAPQGLNLELVNLVACLILSVGKERIHA